MFAGVPLLVHVEGAGDGGMDEVKGLDGEVAWKIEGGAAGAEDLAAGKGGEIDLGKDGVFGKVREGIGLGARGDEARENHAGEKGGQAGTEHGAGTLRRGGRDVNSAALCGPIQENRLSNWLWVRIRTHQNLSPQLFPGFEPA
jgi:hypothetical protein